MKKLMIMAGVVALAAVSQAAVTKWGTGNLSWKDAKGGTYPAQGTAIYLINGDTSLDTIRAAINKDTGVFNTAQDWYYDTGTTGNTKGYVALRETADTDKLVSGQNYNFSALIIDKDSDGAWRFMVSDVFEQTAYTKGQTPITLSFASDKFGANALTASLPGAANGWATVPEPTSAMLLLLGVAGLALRRRRA